ncbi:ABC-type nitrate/sulfonate/bicarbonate transport system, periplasmic component [Clostridium aceticum]|uniref:ABC-type nitrate/sulfonate/bicarbonate transport system, periplasmic component n=1 Tax=Clostridium aceticum TaxID=84022 RepID=A0A0D8I871_9CLOT|nr:MqnA/MqnD/SBP family protein [Clostridium aceticum]AKL97246.1 ABC-type nitrate/sulfonate/bicarbonate transport system, periplasmic component [Clostridium aceticum]KJF26274.1 lipoprotein [Clostridium aceticum]
MKHTLKKALALLMVVILMMGIVACTKEVSQQEDTLEINQELSLRIAALKGPTGMGMAKLMEDNEEKNTAINYEFLLMGSPDDLVGKIINNEVDIAAVPTNLALTLYNRMEGEVQLVAINTLGVLYLLENEDNIHSIEDLRGKKVNTSGKGTAADYIFQYILEENQLAVDEDVLLDYKLQHTELAAALIEGDVDLALLPQPHVSTALMRNKDLRIALDITEEWNKTVGEEGKLAMGCIIVQRKFAENNLEVLNIFLEEYKDSVDFVNQQVEEAAELIAKYEILPNAAIAKEAIPYSNIVYIEAEEAKVILQDFYQMLFDFEPKSIGGKLADEGFYYTR